MSLRLLLDQSAAGMRGSTLLTEVIDPEISRFDTWFQGVSGPLTIMEKEVLRAFLYQRSIGALKETEDRRIYILREAICQLVDKPESVKLEVGCGEDGVTSVVISVAASDVGKALGHRGRYAEALRLLLGAMYGKDQQGIRLHVTDPRKT